MAARLVELERFVGRLSLSVRDGRRWWSHVLCLALIVVVGLTMTGKCEDIGKELDFVHDVVPILREHCGNCHTGSQREGGLSFNSRQELVAGGDSGAVVSWKVGETSELLSRVTTDDEGLRMPPEGARLTPAQVSILERWIAARVPWDDQFQFVKPSYEPPLRPRRPELPPVVDGRSHPIDRILDTYLAKHEIKRQETVSDEVFLRRTHLDLMGLLPSPEELDAFLADSRPDKRARLVDQLLARDRDYAEHWLTFWNDLLRNDYTGTGFITGGRKQITAWLYSSLLENKPYDQMVREIIQPSPESEGFNLGIRWRGDINSSQTQEIQFAQNVAQAFLGVNMKCASCHDSFVDNWKLDQAYGLAAIIATSPLELHRCDKPTGTMAKAAWVFPELGNIDPDLPQPERLGQLAQLMTHPENGRFTRTMANRLWHRFMGRGIVHPTDAMDSEPWSEDLLDYLGTYLADRDYDLKATLRHICTSEAYASRTPTREKSDEPETYVFRGPVARRLTAEQFMDVVWQLTGGAPTEIDAPVQRPAHSADGESVAMVRASLLKSDFLMRSLGRPNRDQIVSMRPTEFTTLEAIDLANGEPLIRATSIGARRLGSQQSESTETLVTWLYRFALSRNPTDGELTLAVETWGNQPTQDDVEDLIWAVIMLPEFQWNR